MKKISVLLGLVVILLALVPAMGYSWIGDTQLREIEKRIEDTERRLLELDKDQLLNRLDWADWGVDLLQNDIRQMEKEMQKKRKEWEKLRQTSMDSEEAWREWEEAGRELDELERKKGRLDSTLERLKRLRDRIKERIKEIKRIYEPKPFGLGLGVGSLSFEKRALQIYEVKLRTPLMDLFYGSNGYEEEIERTQISYLGAEKSLLNFSFPNGALRIPVGIEKFSFQDSISPCIGVMGEYRYQTANGQFSTLFGQIRYGFGRNSVVTFLIGLFF